MRGRGHDVAGGDAIAGDDFQGGGHGGGISGSLELALGEAKISDIYGQSDEADDGDHAQCSEHDYLPALVG